MESRLLISGWNYGAIFAPNVASLSIYTFSSIHWCVLFFIRSTLIDHFYEGGLCSFVPWTASRVRLSDMRTERRPVDENVSFPLRVSFVSMFYIDHVLPYDFYGKMIECPEGRRESSGGLSLNYCSTRRHPLLSIPTSQFVRHKKIFGLGTRCVIWSVIWAFRNPDCTASYSSTRIWTCT